MLFTRLVVIRVLGGFRFRFYGLGCWFQESKFRSFQVCGLPHLSRSPCCSQGSELCAFLTWQLGGSGLHSPHKSSLPSLVNKTHKLHCVVSLLLHCWTLVRLRENIDNHFPVPGPAIHTGLTRCRIGFIIWQGPWGGGTIVILHVALFGFQLAPVGRLCLFSHGFGSGWICCTDSILNPNLNS